MANGDGTEPIDPNETLYRRVPVSRGYYSDGMALSPEAFHPSPRDVDGISISRAKYNSVEAAAIGPSRGGYYVAEMRAGDLFKEGILADPKPLGDDLGHAVLPDLTYPERKTDRVTVWKELLARKLSHTIHGPFRSDAE